MSSAASKDEAKKGLILGIVLTVLNVGLLLALDDRSFAARPWRYVGILAGGVLVFRFLTIGVQGPAVGHDTPAGNGPQQVPASPVERMASTISKLEGRTKIILGMSAAVVVLLVAAPVITDSVREARDRKLERDYAQGEAEYLAQVEAEEQAAPEASGGSDSETGVEDDLAQGDSGSAGRTPNGHSRWVQLPDIIAMAPTDGSVRRAVVVYTAAGGDAGSFILEAKDTELGGADPTYVHDVELFEGEMGDYYVNGGLVSLDDFYGFIGSESAETEGSIEFTQDAVVRSNAYSETYMPKDGH